MRSFMTVKASMATVSFLIFGSGIAYGDILSELREMIDDGLTAEAIEAGDRALAEEKDSRRKGSINEIIGEAYYFSRGEREKSRSYFESAKKSGEADASLFLGRLAMADYNFPEAQRHYADYKRHRKSVSKPLDDEFQYEEAALKEGQLQFERVRELVVIDAVEVERQGFFKHIRIPASAGRIVSVGELRLPDKESERGDVAYLSESGDMMMWSQMNDSTGMMQLMEANRLSDGSISEPVSTPDFLGQQGDAQFPFLSADGTILYYGANGDNSIGGYDIFMAGRDPQTGEYLQPVNMGIPFNSSADDYILAIDEENGVGWWATDRHYLSDGRITIYVYLLPESRVNLEASAEEKRSRSLLKDIRVTWNPVEADDNSDGEEAGDEDDEPTDNVEKITTEERIAAIKEKREEIRRIEPGSRPKRIECQIPLPGGGFINSADDVKSREQKMIVEQYIEKSKALTARKERLGRLRRQYAQNGSEAVGREIQSLEIATEKESGQITLLLSQLYRFLGQQ